jgi:hypothetical protein
VARQSFTGHRDRIVPISLGENCEEASCTARRSVDSTSAMSVNVAGAMAARTARAPSGVYPRSRQRVCPSSHKRSGDTANPSGIAAAGGAHIECKHTARTRLWMSQ